MRSKAVLSIIAFLAAFGISVAVTPRAPKSAVSPYVKTGCAQTETARNITNLLRQDIENGQARDQKLDDYRSVTLSRQAYLVNFTMVIDEYSDASAGIDDSDLPQDFKAAWREHMTAWRNHSDFLNEYTYLPRVRGNGIGSSDRIEFPREKYSEQTKEISDTWFEVLRIARKYDAYIPPEAY